MKNILIILLLCSIQSVAQPYTHEIHNDSLFRVNLRTGDSVFIPSQPQTFRIVRDSAKTAITFQSIATALGFTPSSSGYAINVQALTSSPADNVTTYFGNLPKALTTAAGQNKIFFRKTGTIKLAEIYCYSGTAGTAEAWSIYIRKNNTTDFLVATVSSATNERIFSNNNLSIPIVSGDWIELKSVQPTFATNPLTSIFSGYIIIE